MSVYILKSGRQITVKPSKTREQIEEKIALLTDILIDVEETREKVKEDIAQTCLELCRLRQ